MTDDGPHYRTLTESAPHPRYILTYSLYALDVVLRADYGALRIGDNKWVVPDGSKVNGISSAMSLCGTDREGTLWVLIPKQYSLDYDELMGLAMHRFPKWQVLKTGAPPT